VGKIFQYCGHGAELNRIPRQIQGVRQIISRHLYILLHRWNECSVQLVGQFWTLWGNVPPVYVQKISLQWI